MSTQDKAKQALEALWQALKERAEEQEGDAVLVEGNRALMRLEALLGVESDDE